MGTPRTQAEWDRQRAEVKAAAASTVEAEAKKAARRKREHLAKPVSLGVEDFYKRAKAVEDQINETAEQREARELAELEATAEREQAEAQARATAEAQAKAKAEADAKAAAAAAAATK
jgi:colicin import membrane protein